MNEQFRKYGQSLQVTESEELFQAKKAAILGTLEQDTKKK